MTFDRFGGERFTDVGPATIWHADCKLIGFSVRTLTPELATQLGRKEGTKGVVVTSVQSGSVASRAGVRANDVIVAVGDKDVQTADEFHAAMKSVKPEQGVRLRLIREGARLFLIFRGSEPGTTPR